MKPINFKCISDEITFLGKIKDRIWNETGMVIWIQIEDKILDRVMDSVYTGVKSPLWWGIRGQIN